MNKPMSFTKSRKFQNLISKIIAYVVLIFACIIVLAPFSIIIATSFKTLSDAVKVPFTFYEGYLDFTSYKAILADKDLWVGLKNTLIIVCPIMFTGVFFSALSAYAFSKLRFKAKKVMFAVLLGSMMLPGVITMTPAYLIYDMIGWTDSFLPLMIPNMLGTASCTFYLTQYFKGVPDELMEAAKVDGLGNFGIFIRIMLPLSLPALVAQILLWFISGYNDYFGPMLYLNSKKKYTLQLILNLMVNPDGSWPKIMSACIVIMVPILLLYLVFQKYFIKGITLSSGKED